MPQASIFAVARSCDLDPDGVYFVSRMGPLNGNRTPLPSSQSMDSEQCGRGDRHVVLLVWVGVHPSSCDCIELTTNASTIRAGPRFSRLSQLTLV
jgi:hypothetical protein